MKKTGTKEKARTPEVMPPEKKTALAKHGTGKLEKQVARAPVDPDTLLLKALEQGAPVETLEKLLGLSERIRAAAAKAEYFEALSKFQDECPPIVKTKAGAKNKPGATTNAGQVRYHYAQLDDIRRIAGPKLREHGFSYDFDTEIVEGKSFAGTAAIMCKVVCNLHHIGGHVKQSTFSVPIEKSEYMSNPQSFGSARTFAMRYAFLDVTGLTTADKDNDGRDGTERKPGGGKDHRFQPGETTVRTPVGKSEGKKKDDGKDSGGETLKAAPPENRIGSSTVNTIRSQMKRDHISDQDFQDEFGIPVEHVGKSDVSKVVDQLKAWNK